MFTTAGDRAGRSKVKLYGSIYPYVNGLTPRFKQPRNEDFFWVNQGGATLVNERGVIELTAPTNAGDSIRMRMRTLPAFPYTVTACILFNRIRGGTDFTSGGLMLRQSSDGKLVSIAQTAAVASSTGLNIVSQKWTNPTTFSANYNAYNSLPVQYLWLRFKDDGVNRNPGWSIDGVNYTVIQSARTDFMTADQVGFFASTSNTTFTTSVTLVSWEVVNYLVP